MLELFDIFVFLTLAVDVEYSIITKNTRFRKLCKLYTCKMQINVALLILEVSTKHSVALVRHRFSYEYYLVLSRIQKQKTINKHNKNKKL